MMTTKGLGSLAVAGAAVVALGVSLVSSTLHAQPQDPRSGPVRPGQGPQPPMPPGARPMGGPATMIDDANHLYILQGNRLFKVSKAPLDVVDQTELPSRRGPGRRGTGGGGGGRPGGGGGGASGGG